MAYLSFNSKEKNGALQFVGDDTEEAKELLSKELPLRYTWVIWEQVMDEQKGGNNTSYSDTTKQVSNFSTVQGFWRLWNHLPQPSELLDQKRMVRESGSTTHVIDAIMIFRDGIKPQWEDRLNATGGHFQFQLKPQTGGPQIDEYWNNLVLGVVGATIEPANMITGIRLVDKLSGPRQANGLRIEVWFSNFDDIANRSKLQQSVQQCMAQRLTGETGQLPRCDVKSHIQKH